MNRRSRYTHHAAIVATFSIQAMIWPPKVLTWWLACGGSTSSTLSTRVLSAGTASSYSWHSPGESAKTIKSRMVQAPGQVLCYKALRLLPVPSWAVLLLSRSVMISAWMSLILLRSAARLYSICSICVWGITCFSCTCAHKTHTHAYSGDAEIALAKWSCFPLPSQPLFVWQQR